METRQCCLLATTRPLVTVYCYQAIIRLIIPFVGLPSLHYADTSLHTLDLLQIGGDYYCDQEFTVDSVVSICEIGLLI